MSKSCAPPRDHPHLAPPSSGELYDEWLVMMAKGGDRMAQERLYRRWAPKLARAARRYGMESEAARDLAQESWLGIFKGLPRLKDPKRFRSYAFSILHRRGNDHIRKTLRENKELSDTSTEQNSLADDEISERAAIKQAFAQLPPEMRVAAHLHFVEGLTLREIAEVQAIPDGTAKSRIFHARQKLKAALGSN